MPRIQAGYKTLGVTPMTASIECLYCGARHIVTRGEEGDPDTDMVPCQGSDTCEVLLCGSCRQQCEVCGKWTCEQHIGSDKACGICSDKVDGGRDEIYPDEDPACECIQVDVDRVDTRWCLAHGERR